MKPRIRVAVADDSATMRRALVAMLSEQPDLEVVGEAEDGMQAVELARRLRPDVMTMDIQMPRLNGLEAIAAIMAEAPSRVLVVASVSEGREVDLSFRAMNAGALELIAKPSGGAEGTLREFGRRIVEGIRLMAEVPVVRRWRTRAQLFPRPTSQGAIDIVGIVASTGGPPALAKVLSALPAQIPVPLLIAQHMAPGFAAGLVRWFSEASPLKVELARQGTACLPGHVYLAPDGMDLEVDAEGVLRLSKNAGGHCPSGNRLLSSLAAAYGDRCGGVVMTGMGDDGAAGLRAIRNAGGATLAQDEASCTVYGMPRVAFESGAASVQVSLDLLPSVLFELCTRR